MFLILLIFFLAFSGAMSIKMFIQDLSTVISNIRVQQYNPTLISQVPTVTIEQLKHYEDPIYKSIKKIYQICGSDPSKYSILSEGDSLAAVFYHIKTSLDYLLKPSRPQVSETANRFGRMSLHRSGVVPEVPNMESNVKSDVVCINCGRVGHQSVRLVFIILTFFFENVIWLPCNYYFYPLYFFYIYGTLEKPIST